MKANVSNLFLRFNLRGTSLSTARVTIAKIKMINMGIIPAMTGNQLTKMLNSMTPEEKRFTKRKFRKVWRKFAKSDKKAGEIMGLGSLEPTEAHKRNRSAIISVEMVKCCKD